MVWVTSQFREIVFAQKYWNFNNYRGNKGVVCLCFFNGLISLYAEELAEVACLFYNTIRLDFFCYRLKETSKLGILILART